MKKKIYTLAHNLDLLKQIDNDGNRFTASERADLSEKELGESIFKTKESLLRYYLPLDFKKSESWIFVYDIIKENGYRNILSLGSGPCVQEYLLKKTLSPDSQIVATDFDSFIINKAKLFFPELIVEQFDFFTDDISDLHRRLNIEFDLAIFFGSSYVMDDIEFKKLFADLKKIGVKKIIDFQAGYMNKKNVLMNYLPFFLANFIRRIFGKSQIERYKGKFHGYTRDKKELRRLYKNSGLKIQNELESKTCYRYFVVLE